MDQNEMALTAKRLTQARALLIRDNPFFGRLSLGLKLACAPCGTACTDGERLIFDPQFAKRLGTDREMQFVILHEVLHCVLEHCTRGKTNDSKLFNVACDIVVNSTILGMWGLDTFQVAGTEPMHLTPDGLEGRDFSAEEVYQMLLDQRADQSEDHDPGREETSGSDERCSVDRHDIWKAITDESSLKEAWNVRIREAAKEGNVLAEMPQAVRNVVESLFHRSKVNWKQMLHDFLQYDTYDYNFLPPDRRFSEEEFFLPAYNVDEDLGRANGLWICIDTSASITAELLKEALLEVVDAMRQAGLAGSISFFDGKISDPEPFETVEEFRKIVPKGGGGTSYHTIFQYLKEKMYPDLPRAILVFTDGFVYDWPQEKEAMEVPVLWLVCEKGNTRIPWGRVAEL